MDQRLVSVVIPARNAARTLVRAVRSVLAQDYRPIEVIIVDDGSHDDTRAVAAAFGDPVRLIALPHARGAAAARNEGIRAAAGSIVAFQDADDEWLQGKLSRQVALLLSSPDLVFIACGARFVGPDGDALGPLYGGQTPTPGARAWVGLLARNTIATPTVVAWRQALLDAGGFDAALPVAEDQDMWIRLATRGALGYLDAPLVRVHATPGSLSGVGSAVSVRQQMEFTLPMIERHVAARRSELSAAERRGILGQRLGRAGRSAYTFGHYRDGLRLLARSIGYGFEPTQSLMFLLSAAPPVRWAKRRLRRQTG